MIRLIPIVLLLLAQEAPGPLPPKGGAAGTADVELKVGEQTRSCRLVVPEGLNPANPVPLVFVFHGLGDVFITRYSGFEELGKKKGFIVAFPNGVNRQWDLRASDENRDLRYFDALLEHITSKYNVDLRRVYATGMSMGGFFSNLLASKRSDRIAAIAPHSGGLGVLAIRGIKAKRKYPVMIVQGAADPLVRVEQGRSSRDAYLKEGHAVEYVEIKDLAHIWARSEDITEKMWKFFTDHPMK
jgi:polyhydroxybutyrate depolymerase